MAKLICVVFSAYVLSCIKDDLLCFWFIKYKTINVVVLFRLLSAPNKLTSSWPLVLFETIIRALSSAYIGGSFNN